MARCARSGASHRAAALDQPRSAPSDVSRPLPLVVHVVGARPNYMKIAPVWVALARGERVAQRLVHTGQHYDTELSDVFFRELPLPRPDHELEVGSGAHGEQTARALAGLERVFVELRPDLVVVAGDVNSTLAGALAAVKLNIPVCHVESGLRSFDWTMPEEHNRKLTDHVGTLLLTHCEEADANLRAEGIADDRIAFVGNTMIDTLLATLDEALTLEAWKGYGLTRGNYVLATLHRPQLVDDPDLLARTVSALETLSERLPVVLPVHPRTRARLDAQGLTPQRVLLVPALPYRTFLSLEAAAAAVVTDSGGVQEETTVLGVPCFTLRENTERPVTVRLGTNQLLGLEPERLADIADMPLASVAGTVPPLWDGRAGERAGSKIEELLGVETLDVRSLHAARS
jgi:UDP-N-acetylglucosamine 2-epimerase (non-hydrolysing)